MRWGHRLSGIVIVMMAVLASPGGPASAASIIQDQTNVSTSLQTETGQSFTAEDPVIDTIGFFIRDLNAFLGVFRITYDLYEGAGVGGSLLASQTMELADDFAGWLDLDFSATTLTVGSVYTANVSSESGRGFIDIHQHSFPGPGGAPGAPIPGQIDYVGGDLYWDGAPLVLFDARFRVLVSEVPAPPTLLLVACAAAGLACAGRRAVSRRSRR